MAFGRAAGDIWLISLNEILNGMKFMLCWLLRSKTENEISINKISLDQPQ